MPFSLTDSAAVAIPLTGEKRKRGQHGPRKQTVFIRHALDKAFKHVGGWRYLAAMAQSETPSDRTAFMALLAKVLPQQLKAELEITGGLEVVLRAYVRAEQHSTISSSSSNSNSEIGVYTHAQPITLEASTIPTPQMGACTPSQEPNHVPTAEAENPLNTRMVT